MRRAKRVTALMLALLMVLTSGYGNVSAMPVQNEMEVTEETVTENGMETDTEAETAENEVTEENDATAESEATTDKEVAAEGETIAEPEEETENEAAAEPEETTTEGEVTEEIGAAEESEATVEPEEDAAAEAEPLVNYLVVEEAVVTTPGTQRVMLGIGDGSSAVTSAELSYKNQTTGEIYKTDAKEILDDFVMFEMSYEDESQNGTYQLEAITYTAEGNEITASFAQMGIEAAFGVNQNVETTPDDVLLTEEEVEVLAAETTMDIVTFDEEGKVTSESNIEQALENAGCEASANATSTARKGAKGADATGMSSVVVVLDPGHGGTDGGTSHNGIVEKNVNLKIAQYCKAELDEYAGVVVYMTRTGDTYLSLAERAQVAIDKKADVFISLHNNANDNASVSGACVYYPNENYNKTVNTIGKSLATIIESKLADLGLASGGIKIRNSENGTQYPDGSAADYYGVIKRCKENGIPGLIVEHAFVTNASDVANYLSTDAQLKKLGVADATAIAEYYGLSKGLGFNSIQSKSSTTMELAWSAVTGVTGYCIYRSTSSGDGFEEVANITPASTTTWKDTGLTPGTTYYYKIRTYTKSDSGTIKYGKYSSVASGTTMQKPEISSIKSKSSKKLIISWATVNNAANYEIYRATKKSGTYKLIATVAGVNRVNYIDSKVKAGKLYYYKIRSVGQIDNTTVYSDYSEIVSGRTATIPTEIKVKSQDSNTLRISWKADENVSGYVIKRATSANGKYTKLATVSGAATTTYDDTTVKANTTYYYKIQSYNHNNSVKGYSGYSSAVSGKTVKKTSITKIVSNSSTKQTISWKKVDGANGYVIYQSTSKNGTYKKIATIKSGNTTSYKVTKLKAGTRYYYKVRTRNKVNGKTGYGSYSTIRNAWAGEKTKITAVAGNTGNRIKISWNPVNGAESYDIYRATSEKGTYTKIGSAEGTAVSYIDKKLKMTKKYYYKVEARMKGYKATGTSGLSKAVGGYPVRTTMITSVGSNEQGLLQISWNKVKNTTGYRLYRSTELNGSYQLITTISDYKTTTYTDAAASAGVTYYYKIVLINKYDGKTIYGKYSQAVSGVLLTAPQNVTVTSVAENQLNLTWTAVTGASGYVIYRSTELNGTYTEIGAVASQALTVYSDTTVTKGVTYYYKIKAVDNNNNSSVFSSAASGCAVAKLVITGVTWSADRTSIQLTWNASTAAVTGYEVYKNSASAPATQTKVATTTALSCIDIDVASTETYYYRVRPYTEIKVNNKKQIQYGVFSDTISTNTSDYRIMGSPQVTEQQMVAMYKASGKTYPASVYTSKGAATIEAFCKIVYEECCIEGVRPEVIFAQICHETAYLQFGGQVQASQCNFGGLGATDDGASGGVFADVRTGVRTQVQHMKAYASTDPLKQTCIDGRFSYVNRGTAEFVQQLGKGNWATDTSYDVKLMTYINKIKAK